MQRLLITIAWLLCLSGVLFSLDLSFKIQETTNNAADDYPVTFTVPLPTWTYTDISSFRVTDANGTTVPAQISVFNKHWQAGYIRHILVTLKTSLAANEKKVFHLKDDGGNTGGAGLTLTETGTDVTVVTGPLKFKVKKQNFNLFDEVWLDLNNNGAFDAGEQLITSSPDNGGMFSDRNSVLQKSSDVANPMFKIEEAGPVRAIIRVEAPTLFTSTANMRHGYVCRIYAYAGKPYVKVEYTLKNSAFNHMYSYPLYCKDFSIKTRLNLGAVTVTLGKDSTGNFSQALGGSGVYVFQNYYNTFSVLNNSGASLGSGAKSLGWIDASDGTKGVTLYSRYFWEMWPNGLELDTGNVLYARMLPKWDAGYYWSGGTSRTAFVKSTAGLHWLDDMQQLTKEFLYSFHAGNVNTGQTVVQAKQFQKNPVGVIPMAWWKQTRATLDMDGIIPLQSVPTSPVSTDPQYMTQPAKAFGWPNFGGDIIGAVSRMSSCEPGDVPSGAMRFMATENPQYYYQDRTYAYGDMNVRPEWMGGEADASVDSIMQFTTLPYSPSPYCNYSWRPGWGGYGPTPYKVVAAYLSGTDHHGWTSRDLEHMWFYQVEEFAYYDGMPLIKDWYSWLGKFIACSAYEKGDNRIGRFETRGHGHAMDALMGGYKLIGDSSMLKTGNVYVGKLKVKQCKRNGQIFDWSNAQGESPLEIGYLSRGIIRYMEEQKNKSCKEYTEAYGLLEGMIQWNFNWGNWGYWVVAGTHNAGVSGTSMPLADPEIWMYLHTGYTPYKTHVRVLADAKIYGDLIHWNLFDMANFPVYPGRLCQYAWENPRLDTVPPAAITDLSGQATQPAAGTKLWVKADSLPANKMLYFAVRSFDSSDNVSKLSNIYSVNLGAATSTYLTWSPVPTADHYHVKWCHKNIVENDSSTDTTSKYYFWAANAIGNNINSPIVTSTEENGPSSENSALDCYPNPFNPTVFLSITLRAKNGPVMLTVTDVSGRLIKSFSPNLSKGRATVAWNADNMRGEKVPSGLYVVRVKSGNYSLVRKVLLAK